MSESEKKELEKKILAEFSVAMQTGNKSEMFKAINTGSIYVSYMEDDEIKRAQGLLYEVNGEYLIIDRKGLEITLPDLESIKAIKWILPVGTQLNPDKYITDNRSFDIYPSGMIPNLGESGVHTLNGKNADKFSFELKRLHDMQKELAEIGDDIKAVRDFNEKYPELSFNFPENVHDLSELNAGIQMGSPEIILQALDTGFVNVIDKDGKQYEGTVYQVNPKRRVLIDKERHITELPKIENVDKITWIMPEGVKLEPDDYVKINGERSGLEVYSSEGTTFKEIVARAGGKNKESFINVITPIQESQKNKNRKLPRLIKALENSDNSRNDTMNNSQHEETALKVYCKLEKNGNEDSNFNIENIPDIPLDEIMATFGEGEEVTTSKFIDVFEQINSKISCNEAKKSLAKISDNQKPNILKRVLDKLKKFFTKDRDNREQQR